MRTRACGIVGVDICKWCLLVRLLCGNSRAWLISATFGEVKIRQAGRMMLVVLAIATHVEGGKKTTVEVSCITYRDQYETILEVRDYIVDHRDHVLGLNEFSSSCFFSRLDYQSRRCIQMREQLSD